MTKRSSRGRILSATGLLAVAMLVAGSPASAEAPAQAYDMPSQPLGEALAEAAQRSGVAIIAPTPLVECRRAPALKGQYSPE